KEWPHRIPYFEALQLLLDADFLAVPGSDDPHYTASKIYPYILANKPLIGVFHPSSSVCEILRTTRAGTVFPIGGSSEELCNLWNRELGTRAEERKIDWAAFAPYMAKEMTKKQCELLDQVVLGGNRVSVH